MGLESSNFDLLARATTGDTAALELLLLRHCTSLSHHIGPKIPGHLQGVLSVDDVLQQTLVRAFQNIRRFEPRTDRSFSVWLKTIAENELKNAVTALTCEKRGGPSAGRVARPVVDATGSLIDLIQVLSDGRGTPSQSAVRRETVEGLRVAIAALPDDQREAVQLYYLQGADIEEAAAIMDRSTGGVRGLLHRAKSIYK